jgi:hypothetical protein
LKEVGTPIKSDLSLFLYKLPKNKSPRLSRSGELFLSLTKQNYLK